ncbi:Uncharacterised protein at_DN2560 [Pycnogonum litorale]
MDDRGEGVVITKIILRNNRNESESSDFRESKLVFREKSKENKDDTELRCFDNYIVCKEILKSSMYIFTFTLYIYHRLAAMLRLTVAPSIIRASLGDFYLYSINLRDRMFEC